MSSRLRGALGTQSRLPVRTAERDKWWAADLAACEAADWLVDADGGGLVVEVDDRSVDAVEVAGAGVVVDADAVVGALARGRASGGG
jgi:hypothetical protein